MAVVPKGTGSMPDNSSNPGTGPNRLGSMPSGAAAAVAALADLVWPWRWEAPAGWRAGHPSAPVFLGRKVEAGWTFDALAQCVVPGERETLQRALEKARQGERVRTDLHMIHESGRVHPVRLAALPALGSSEESVTLVFVATEAVASESDAGVALALGDDAIRKHHVDRLAPLLARLRHAAECNRVELVFEGCLRGEGRLSDSEEELEESAYRVAEPLAEFGDESREIPIRCGEERLATLYLHGRGRALWPAVLPRGVAEELIGQVRGILAEWSCAVYRSAWQTTLALLGAAQASWSQADHQALRDLCRHVAQTCAAERAHLWVREEQTGLYRLLAQWGLPSEESEALQVMEVAAGMLPLAGGLRSGWVKEPIAAPRDFEGPGVRHQLALALDDGAALLLDWCAGEPRVREAVLEPVRLVASLWFAATRLAVAAEQAARLKSDFVATMSHELRTPLNTLMGYTDLLAGEEFGPLTAEQREVLERMAYSARELLDLINATLDFGRFETQQVTLEEEAVSLAELVRELDRELAYHRRRRGLSFAVAIEEGAGQLRTDREKLRLVLKNLLANAIKFTPSGGVEVSARREGGEIEIAVKDTGVGIDPAVLPVIFQPFRQGEPAATRHFGGVGLGLYVVRRLVDVLGGSVSVESKPAGGSIFRVRLPAESRSGAAHSTAFD